MSNKTKTPELKILDSTLREGHQSIHPKYHDRGVVFTRKQQYSLVEKLVDFGVDYIEILAPVRSNYSMETAKSIVDIAKGSNTKIVTHCRCTQEDVESSLESGVQGINLFLNSSAYSKFSFEDTVGLVNASLDIIDQSDTEIETRFSFEDAFRSDVDKMLDSIDKLSSRLDRAGFPDTTGTTYPETVGNLIHHVKNNHPDLEIECHFHNDIGFATYNSITALINGADVISTTILGLGERTGIVSTSSLLAAFSRLDGGEKYLLKKYKVSKIKDIADYIAECLDVKIPLNIPVVSDSAFFHVSGVHASSHLRNPKSYYSLDPALFGQSSGNICWSSSVAGASSMLYRAEQLNINITKVEARKIATIVREKAKKEGGISPESVDQIIKDYKNTEK